MNIQPETLPYFPICCASSLLKWTGSSSRKGRHEGWSHKPFSRNCPLELTFLGRKSAFLCLFSWEVGRAHTFISSFTSYKNRDADLIKAVPGLFVCLFLEYKSILSQTGKSLNFLSLLRLTITAATKSLTNLF